MNKHGAAHRCVIFRIHLLFGREFVIYCVIDLHLVSFASEILRVKAERRKVGVFVTGKGF